MSGGVGSDPLASVFARLRDAVDADSPVPAREGAEPVSGADAAPAATELGGPASGPEVGAGPAPGVKPPPEPGAPGSGGVPGTDGSAHEVEPAGGYIVPVDLVDVAPVEPEPHWPVFAVAESTTLDDAGLRRRRDAAVHTALGTLTPRMKRLLQDEQNDLLDAIRRQKGKVDALSAVPGEAEYVRRWVEVARPELDDCYALGRALGGGRTRAAPPDLVEQLVALVARGLRERVVAALAAAIDEGPYEGAADRQRAIASTVGARYREWRTRELTEAVGDLAAWAFARGVFDATPDGTRCRWLPAEVEQCPDADDNALEPTPKGSPFPTGQSCPPAHPGCRCLVVPVGGADG